MNRKITFFTASLFFFLLFIMPHEAFAQPCSGGTEFGGPLVSLGNSTTQTVDSLAAGEYFLLYVCNGATYDIHTCPENDFDTYLSLINDATLANLGENDDACGAIPLVDQASVTYVATFTGWIRVLLTDAFPIPCTVNPLSITTVTVDQTAGSACAPLGYNCANPLVVGAVPFTSTGLTTCNMSNDFGNASSCGSFLLDGPEFVIEFTPTTTDCYAIDVTNSAGAVGLFVWDACNAGAVCVDFVEAAAGDPSTTVTLTAATTYYILVSTDPDILFGNTPCTDFDIAIDVCPPAPPGATCGDPLVIASLPYNQTGMTTCGFGNDYITSSCGDVNYISGEDFVFEYTTVNAGCYSLDFTNTDTYLGFYIWDACPDGGSNCVYAADAAGTTTSGQMYLDAATTYYIIVSTWDTPACTDFDIAFAECAQAGETCAEAIPLATGSATGITTCAMGDNYNDTDACGSTFMNGEDVVFTYTPPADGCYNVALTNPTNTAADVGLFILDDCPDVGTANCVASATMIGGVPSTIANLLASVTYTIVVASNAPECTGFDINIAATTCPAGNVCANPIVISPAALPTTLSDQTSCGSGNDYTIAQLCGETYGDAEDVVFSFTPTVTDCYTFDLNPTASSNAAADVGLFILDNCPDASGNCLASATLDNGLPMTDAYLSAGVEYFIVVSAIEFSTPVTYSPSCTDFDLVVSAGGTNCPIGTDCNTPLVVTTGTTAAIDLCGLGNDYDDADACGGFYMNGEDVIMTFTPATTDCYTIATSGTANSNPAADVGLYILSDCPDAIGAACLTNEETENGFPTVDLSLTGGVTYYIMVSAVELISPVLAMASCTEIDLTITSGSPNCPPGATCQNPVNLTGVGSYPGMTSCGFGDDYQDTDVAACNNFLDYYLNAEEIVMTFTAPFDSCYIFTTSNGSDMDANSAIFVFDDCPNMSPNCIATGVEANVDPMGGMPTTTAYLTAGQQYYVVFSAIEITSNAGGVVLYNASCNDFDLDISYCPPSAPIQDCVGAIPVCQDMYSYTDGFFGGGMDPDEIPGGTCLLTGELNSIWFTVNVQTSGDLSFLITPVDALDDYDFAVFDITSGGCAGVPTGASPMVSCNYSLSSGITGATGPSLPGSPLNNQDAAGTLVNPSVAVLAGETYVIIVSNFSTSTTGFDIDFSLSTASIFDATPPDFLSVDSFACGNTTFDVIFNEPVTCASILACDFQVTFPDMSVHLLTDVISGSDCATGGNFDNEFNFTVDAPMNQNGTYTLEVIGGCGGIEDNCMNVQSSTTIDFDITDCATCSIMNTVSNIQCDDEGTPSDPSDDTFTFDVTVTGTLTGATWVADDAGSTTGSYGTPTSFGPFPISGGAVSFTITDVVDATCTTPVMVSAPPTCSNACDIMAGSANNILCSDNGTPTDPSDDTYTFDITVTGSNTGSSWIATDPSATTGNYGAPTVFGPYPISGGDLNFTISDADSAGCTTGTIMISAPAPCSNTCAISAVVANVLCNDGGTPADPSDDTFTFEATVTGSNTGAGWTANDANSTAGGYGVAVTFGPYPISGGNLSFTITDDADGTCTTPVMVTAPATCSGTCSIANSVANILCNDQGTPTDPSDDTYTFDVTVTGSNTGAGWTAADPNTTTGTYGTPTTFGPYLISGGNLSFNIEDDADATCITSVSITAPSPCSNTCAISATNTAPVCDNNGTPSDPSDDTYTFTVTVTGSNTGSTWSATDDNTTSGGYGVAVTFGPYPISGGDQNFTITDNVDAACTTTLNVAAPASCSGTCTISAATANFFCDDNGTPSDPSDDTFTFDVTVTGSNTAATWTADDPNATTGNYGAATPFGPYPISGGNLTFTITDDASATCTAPVTANAPAPCSDACNITSSTSNILCDDNGTPTDPSDDTYTFEVIVTGSNTGASWAANDPNSTIGGYGATVTFGPYPISGGSLSFAITDVDSSTCSTAVMVTAPATCSDLCMISAVTSNIQCDDAGTPSDPSDDTFTFDVVVTGSNTGASWVSNDPNAETGAYGATVMFGPFLISGGAISFTINDVGDVTCNDMVSVTPPAPCSGTCSIGNSVTNIQCNDAGTPSDPSDDTFTFDVTVTGSNTAATWSADDPNSTTGAYGAAVPFGPYPISGGNLSFTITDDTDATCTSAVSVTAPATCSDLCDISATTANILCDDAGTPSDPSDDTYTFEVTVTGSNTGSSWTADDANATSGSYGVAVTFGPYPISGGNQNFDITDNVDGTCMTNVTVTAPMPCSGACIISATTSNIACDDNGTPSDPSDDTYTFDVTVTGSNTGAGWTADDPNATTGTYGAAVTFGPYPISGGNLTIIIMDDTDATCTTTFSVTAPAPCSDACTISATTSNIQCDDNGTPSDPSDDTYTFDVTVTGSNTGAGWTANDPNGTTGTYGTAVTFGPYPISGGNLSFTITDDTDAACTDAVSVTAPMTCSDMCMITATTASIMCDDNGTPVDPSDDTYTFTVTVTGANTGASWTADDPNATTGAYGSAVTFGPYPISGGNLSFNITDITDLTCTVAVSVTAPNTCSGTCSISNAVANIQCDDNGTPSDPSDDTYTFDVTVTGSNTGAGWTADDANTTTGTYGTAITFGPYPISGGNLNFTITDDDDATCSTAVSVTAPATCSDLCMITATTADILCDDNGTPSDPSDDTYTFTITVTGSNTGLSWNATDPNATSGSYGAAISFGPYPISGGNLNFDITDNVDATCMTSVSVTAPSPCSGACTISATTANIVCDDNGTPSDPSDDTYTFDVTVTGSNTGAGWTADDPNATTGTYGAAVTFGPYPISGGDLNFTITDDTDATCTAAVSVTAPATCSPPACMISAVTANILCDDNGTPSDPSDDTYTFDVTVTGTDTGPGWTADDPNSTAGTYGVAVTFGPYPISGGNISFTITDDTDATCTASVSVTAPATCSPPMCMITATTANIICDDNGTPSDPSDDTYTFDVTVTGSDTGPGWTANDPNATTGTYGAAVTFGPYPISGGDQNFTIADDTDATCTAAVSVTAPATCSDACTISATTANIVCDDNGTPTDPSDDTYTFDVTVTGSNTGAGWTANDPNATTGNYGTAVTFGPYPISGGSLSFSITDDTDAACTAAVNVTPPATCSDMCMITATTASIMCNDNGTPVDPSDDTYTFTVTVTGANTGASWIADDPNATTGTYGTAVTFGPFPISGGNLSFTITDITDATCTVDVTVTAPSPCSGTCSISNSIANIQCDDNGTPSDPSDDTYSFDVTVTGSNTGAGWTADDANTTTGTYGTAISFGPYPISGGNLNFTITDDDDATCLTAVSVTAPATCSDLCMITATTANILCDDNGTPSDPSDDTYTFTVTVTGANTGLSWNANDANATSGSYGTAVTFGPYPISGGNLNFDISDNLDATCMTSVSVTAPAPCSGACTISATTANIACDDNGTPSDPSDDTYTFDVTVTGSNTAAGWSADDPNSTTGTYGAAVTFGPYPISGGNLNFTITDDTDATCTATVAVTAPATCSPPACMISATTANIICDDNGTPSDPSDDTYTFDVTVTGSDTGPGWSADDPNNTTGTYGTAVTFGPYPISGGNINFTITDDTDATCTAAVSVTAPATCSPPMCMISATTANIICDDNGTPSDPSDDTYTFDVIVTGSDTGPGWTANDPNSTTGTYGAAVTFGPYPISGGNINFTITDDTDATCTAAISVTAPAPCSDLCMITATTASIMCNDNGTPADPSDDTYTFTVTVTGVNTGASWMADDPNNTTGTYGTAVTFGPYPISGGNLNFTITDIADAGCSVPVNVTAPSPCSGTCSISNSVANVQCDDNGTPSDPSDDTYTFDVTVTGSNTGAGWTANDANATTGTYGTAITFGPYPISGGNLNFTITDDDDATCSTAVSVTAPATCSDLCMITATTANILCDDNGTPSDPSDDTYTFTVTVMGANTGLSWNANDPNATSGSYSAAVAFGPYPISGGNLNFDISDNLDATCMTSVSVTAPAPCSGACTISATTANIVCDDNGTPTDPSDDTYTFDVTVTGSNTGAGWTANDPNSTTGAYGAAVTFGPYPISGGNLNFTITDDTDAGCTAPISVTAPATCSDQCMISATTASIMCNDNGTPVDPSDDTYTFTVTVTGANTGASWTADDANNTTGTYGTAITFGPYPISGGNLNFNITDDTDATCTVPVNVTAPSPCSGTCSISNSVANVQCDDNGTPSDPSDDTYTFDVTVTGSNTGAGWTADDANTTTGVYGTVMTFGPYPISGGNLNFTITDDDDATCTTSVSVTAPATCSDECMITATTANILCDDNGTPSDPSDDTYTFTVTVMGANTGLSWNANDPNATSGSYGAAVVFGPYPISGGNLNFDISDNLDATCMTAVSVAAPAPCSGACTISSTTANIVCDDAGTPSDPSDDTYTFDVTVTGSNTGGGWAANDPNSTTGAYGVAVTFGPYPISGGNLTFTITDNTDGACTTPVSINAPATCSDLCLITAMTASISCNDNGTPVDPSDDTYTFTVTVTGANTGASWTADDPNNTSGTYGTAVTFGPYPISGGNLNFTITDDNDATCSVPVNVTAPNPCSGTCSISNAVSNIQCDDNGTPTDPSDDTYTFVVTVTGSNTGGGWIANDANATTGAYGVATTFGPYPISGGNLNFTITDITDATCATAVSVTAPAPCSDQCMISATIANILCNDNGTPSDPSDDTYTFSITVMGANTGLSWNADDPNATSGSYGVAVMFGPYPISGGNLNFDIADNLDASCMTSVSVIAPAPCSGACTISATTANIVCDDNGTPSNPNDDTYTFDVTVTGSNTGASWTASDPNGTTGIYGTPISFGPYPISGGNLVFVITDDVDGGCIAPVNVTAPAPCSAACMIGATTSNILCNDNGTPLDPSDDTYTFTVTVNGVNTGASWTADDPNTTTGAYGTAVTFGPYPISAGDLNFTITDITDAGCSVPVAVTAPNTCSGTCNIGHAVSNIQCDDNGTPSDPTDDTYTFNITVTGSNTGAGWTADDINATTGVYGVSMTFGPYPISGGDLNFTITDDADATCTTAVSVTAPPPCSDLCMISATTANITCNDSGTPSDPSDDTYTFTVTVMGANTGLSWNANDPNATSGSYGVAVTFGPYPISGGDLSIDIADNLDASCMTSIAVTAPAPCSGACNISATTANIVCDDNGTPTDPSDDTYTFDVTVTGSNTGASWTSSDPNATSGAYGTAVTFGPYPISGGNLVFNVTDDVDGGCSGAVNVTAPPTCSDACMISASTASILCDDNGTPLDPSDDTYTFTVTVTGANTGASWTADDANTTTGTYGTGVVFGPYPISGGDQNFTITDVSDAGCTAAVNVNAPATCSGTCSIGHAISNTQCNDNGTPSDPSDDTYTFDLTVTGSNTAASWSADDPNTTNGAYGVAVTFGPYPISGGDISFSVTDATDAGCTTVVNAIAPPPCSNDCTMNAMTSNIQCSDNGTPADPSDDTYTFDVVVTGSNLSLSWNADDVNATSGSYGVSVTFGPYPISGGDLNFIISDNVDVTCSTPISVTAPAPCSNGCNISAVSSNILCNDNGTPLDPSDDTYSFDLLVTGSNTGASWTADDPNATTGNYGTVVSFGPYPINGGDLSFTVSDISDATCVFTVNITAPGTCSGTCNIGHSVDNVVCDDNGTPSDPSDDTYTFDITVSGSNTGAGWAANDANSTMGGYGVPISFGPFSIATGSLNFVITDDTDGGCTTAVTVNPPATCSGCLVTVDLGPDISINCNTPQANVTVNFTGVSAADAVIQWAGPDPNLIQDADMQTIVVPGTYYVTVTSPLGCSGVDSIMIGNEDLPTAMIDGGAVITCDNPCTTLTASSSLSIPQYTWTGPGINSSNMSLPSVEACASGTYSLVATDATNGCSSAPVFFQVDEVGGFNLSIDAAIQVISPGERVTLDLVTDLTPAQIVRITWTPNTDIDCTDCPTVVVSPTTSTTYTVEVEDDNGCIETASVIIVVQINEDVYVPTAFSPNDDGVNDLLSIYGGSTVDTVLTFSIYNRWGGKMYEYRDFEADGQIGWDGTFKGKVLDPATFIWVAEILFASGEVEVLQGEFILVK